MTTPGSPSIPDYDRAPQYADDIPLQDMVEFAENPEPRCPCVIVLNNCDWQSSESLAALNQGIQMFKRALENDPLASLRVEPAIVMYGWDEADIYEDFGTVDMFNPGALGSLYSGWGGRKGAGPIGMALDMIEDRKRKYKDSGISYYRPWMLHIAACAGCVRWSTSLGPSGASNEFDWQRLNMAELNKEVAFFAVDVAGLGKELLAPGQIREPLQLKGLAFEELFLWLSNSMSRVSSSRPGDEVRLDVDGLKNWAVT